MISFCGKLIVDKDFYKKVKSDNPENIIQYARAVVENTNFYDKGDVYLKASNVGKRVRISMDYSDYKDIILVESDRNIHERPVFQQLMMIGCVLNNIKLLDYGNLKLLIKEFKNHLLNKSS